MSPAIPADFGIEVIDLAHDPAFVSREVRAHDLQAQGAGLQALALAFVEEPESILQQLVEAAIHLCGAESAGISIERTGGARREDGEYGNEESASDELSYEWVATAGRFQPFRGAILPSSQSFSITCLERGTPQLLRLSKAFFESSNVHADTATDGLLIPFQAGGTRGTIWILAHGREQAFDADDLGLTRMFASFASLAVAQQQRQTFKRREWAATAVSVLADALARRINQPLDEIAALIHEAATSGKRRNARSLADELAVPMRDLKLLVDESLRAAPAKRKPN